ncbi:MAG TPA: PRC-barrel domain-containing protein [Chloroflexota bacterium]|jgi:sporulation protein YlmC with PRC-barrel domain
MPGNEMKASELTNRPIVSLNGGVKVGEVSDLTLDATKVQVSAVLLRGNNGNSVVPYPAVRHIGPDAVTIDDSGIVQAPVNHGGSAERRISTLTGLPVLNEQGIVIGSVDDLEFDEESGRVTAFLIHRGGVMGIGGSHEGIAASAIRGIGPQMVTVDLTPAASASKMA